LQSMAYHTQQWFLIKPSTIIWIQTSFTLFILCLGNWTMKILETTVPMRISFLCCLIELPWLRAAVLAKRKEIRC
jgi:hypothetical protein